MEASYRNYLMFDPWMERDIFGHEVHILSYEKMSTTQLAACHTFIKNPIFYVLNKKTGKRFENQFLPTLCGALTEWQLNKAVPIIDERKGIKEPWGWRFKRTGLDAPNDLTITCDRIERKKYWLDDSFAAIQAASC